MADGAATKKTLPMSSGLPTAGKTIKRGAEDKKTTQLLVILLLFACCAASVFFFTSIRSLGAANQGTTLSPPPAPDVAAITEAEDLKAVGSEIDVMNKHRNIVMQTALLAEVSGVLPVAPESTLASSLPGPMPSLEAGGAVVEPEPPSVTVLAVMILNGDRVALIDVDGEEGGLIVRPGSKFSGGTARIAKIDAKGVTFIWRKKKFEVAMTRP